MRWLAAGALLACAIVPAVAGPGEVARALAEARVVLAAGDGIAAEARLRDARAAGAGDDAVRALMGEALLAQNDLARARQWLGPATFTPATRGHGFRMLGRLELRERRLPEAGKAFDRALEAGAGSSGLWTDIARLRFAGGEKAQAMEAADRALALDPASADALWFRGLLVRDQSGPGAAMPWFEAALGRAPADAAILSDKAATLVELGRNADALAALRQIHKLAPGRAGTFQAQAVMAARAGEPLLARRILLRNKAAMRDVPGAVLLNAALELEAGNVNVAVEQADRLLRFAPDNRIAQNLLARALARAGDADAIVARFGGLAERPGTSPYLALTVARALEETGQRPRAVAILRKVTRSEADPGEARRSIMPAGATPAVLARRYADVPGQAGVAIPFIRGSIGQGDWTGAGVAAERLRALNPGAPDAHLAAGDVLLMRGETAAALAAYQTAARIAFGEAELVRLDDALRRLGRARDADLLVVAFAAWNPQNPLGVRMLANVRARNGQWRESARLLQWLADRGGRRDAALLADLGYAHLQAGERPAARRFAGEAVLLQPALASVRQIARMTGLAPN